MDNNEQDDLRKTGNGYARYSGMAIQMVAIIGVMAFIGYRIDKSAAHETQWVTAVMALAGVFISLYLVIRGVKS